jgi:hypothetical protein
MYLFKYRGLPYQLLVILGVGVVVGTKSLMKKN